MLVTEQAKLHIGQNIRTGRMQLMVGVNGVGIARNTTMLELISLCFQRERVRNFLRE